MTAYLSAWSRESDGGTYRYELSRRWSYAMPRRTACFVMLNPSTADGAVDDPTIRRCVGFARREGCGGMRVVNLSPLRATHPRDLHPIPAELADDNVARVEWVARRADLVIAAWGASVPPFLRPERDAVLDILRRRIGHELMCLGHTMNGSPRHPLYVPGDAELVELLQTMPTPQNVQERGT